MSLIDDTCDGCGSRFDPMGDPLLTRTPTAEEPYRVLCAMCAQPSSMTWATESVEALAEGLGGHVRIRDTYSPLCACGNWRDKRDDGTRHRAHVAQALVAAGVVRLAGEVRAEALREAADKWQVGDWSNVLLPKPVPPAVPVIAYSQRVLDWLRDRAALAAEPDASEGA